MGNDYDTTVSEYDSGDESGPVVSEEEQDLIEEELRAITKFTGVVSDLALGPSIYEILYIVSEFSRKWRVKRLSVLRRLVHTSVKELIEEANKLFDSVGLQCKGWSISGSNPHPDVTDDGLTIGVGGMEWCPMIDTVTVKIPPLHFGKKTRGKIRVGTEVFDGTFEDLM